jgi:hypothetical protein
MAVKIVNKLAGEKLLGHDDLKQGRFYVCKVAPDDLYIGKLLFATGYNTEYGVWIDLSGVYSSWTSRYSQFGFIEVDVTITIE